MSNLKIDEARREVADLERVVDRLERRLEKQGVVMQALFALLQQTPGVTEEALLDRVRQIEQARAEAKPRTCSKCGRTVGARPERCMYCGEERRLESAFELM